MEHPKSPEQVEGIRREYEQINESWLKLHFRALVGLVVFVGVMEILLYFPLLHLNLISIDRSAYFYHYFLAPSGLNLLLVLCSWLIQRQGGPLKRRMYAVSLTFAAAGFVVYTVHISFPSLFMAMAVPMILTTAYEDLTLTTVTAAVSLVCKAGSDLFCHWDSDVERDLTNSNQAADFILSLVILLTIYVLCVLLIRTEQKKNNVCILRELEQLRTVALTDPLTGVGNRQSLRQALEEMIQDDAHAAYTLVILDLDNFKNINDSYGHQQGDHYLQELGTVLRETEKGTPFRFGGDEFCIVFRNAADAEVLEACRGIQARYVQRQSGFSGEKLTVSFGAAVFVPGMTTAELLRQADAALYEAKRTKNAVHFFQEA